MSVFPIAPDGVLLHVGVHKTGTTAIQAALADSRRELASRDVRYPGKLQAQHRAALALLGRPWGWNNRGGGVMDREHFDRLVRRTRKAPGRVVISSEFSAKQVRIKQMKWSRLWVDLGPDRFTS